MENIQSQQIEQLVQFQHPEKLLIFTPNLAEALIAAILGLDLATYRSARDRVEAQSRKVAHELLTDQAFAGRVDRLPFHPGAAVVGVGDANTEDLASWLEILRHLLELRRPQDQIRVINAGVSAQTTSQALSRFSATMAQKPEWVICALGSADALRVGSQPTKTLVGLNETARNLAELRHIARTQTDTSWVWVTPPTVDERITANYPPFQRAQLMLSNADLMAIGHILRRQTEPVVDVQAIFGCPPAPEFVRPSGPTPSLVGQREIAKALVECLTS